MKNRYCGACRGERGCKDCKTAVRTVRYESLTEFSATGSFKEHAAAMPNKLLLVADIGTTTLGFVCANEKGEVLASYGAENPQRSFSADVIGRIDAACHGAAEELTKQIREALAKGFLFVLQKVISELRVETIPWEELPVRVALAGNTTMQHFLLGYSVEGMARAPFTPYSTEGVHLTFSELFSETPEYKDFPEGVRRAETFIFPCMSAFVGGDVLAGAYALWLQAVGTKAGDFEGEICLLVDFGTNGELFLSVHGKVYATAAAMGSAFEGGRFAYASDLFALMAKALREGAADETGLLTEPYFTESFFGLEQEDIRTFQLAKGAIRAGIELLCKRAGICTEQIGYVFLAGGAGKYCKEEDLLETGILPKCFKEKITIVGNSCIGGLLCYLKNPPNVIQYKGEVINLAKEPEFEALYYRFMEFWKEESEER